MTGRFEDSFREAPETATSEGARSVRLHPLQRWDQNAQVHPVRAPVENTKTLLEKFPKEDHWVYGWRKVTRQEIHDQW